MREERGKLSLARGQSDSEGVKGKVEFGEGVKG